MKHLKYLALLLLAVVLVVGLTACTTAMVDPDDMPGVPELPQSFTVTFADQNGNVIKTQQVREGEAATPPSAAKVPEVPDHAFVGWDADINAITGNITVRPVYEKIRFAIEFHAQDGRLLAGVKVDRGQTPAAPQTAQIEGYHFVGWSDGTTLYPEVPVPTDDMTLFATYEINLYEVTFVDALGEVKTTVEHGSDATAPEARVPAGKRFDGWDVDFTSVTGDLTVTARYVTIHTVTFVDWDGTPIGAPQIIDEGTDATAPADPARVGYTFAGWDKVFVNVGTDIEVKALYTINQYTVTFLDADGTPLKVKTTDYGTAVIAPVANAPEGMLFVRWVDEAGHEVSDFRFTAADLTVKAVYARAITVVFMSRDGVELARFVVPEGSSVTAPEVPTIEGMRFTGWDNGYENVTENVTVTAQYVKIWTVIFVDYDGTQLGDAQIVDEGTAAVAPTDPSNKEGHHFTAWDTAFDAVTSDLTVKALYEINTYTVRFVDWMGNELCAAQTINWNAAAAAPDAPARVDWTFARWDRDFDAVTEDMTVTATYTPNFNPIYNQEDLANLKNAADGSFWGLMGDIEVSNWASVTLLAGVTFTGDGHTVSGLTKPLFSTITGNNTVKNLTVSGTVSASSGSGMLATEVKGAAVIANVTVEGSVTGTNAAGFVCTYSGATSNTLAFIGCTNNATVKATSGRAGGMLAYVSNSAKMTTVFVSCVNKGTITAKTNAGGILGYAYRCGDVNLDNCENRGAIAGGNGVGGLVGATAGPSSPSSVRLTVTYSANYATVTGTNQVGGLLGLTDAANASVTIENSINCGNVKGTTYVGGAVGLSKSSNNGNSVLYLRGIAVYADVEATAGYAGGMLGREEMQSYAAGLQVVLDGCLVKGTVKASDAAAAVIGDLYKDGRSPTQSVSVSLSACVFDVTLDCGTQSATIIGKYEYKNNDYTLTVTGADTCLFTEALATGVTYYDSTGAVTTAGLKKGTPTLTFFNDYVKSVNGNSSSKWVAVRWCDVDGKLLPRADVYVGFLNADGTKITAIFVKPDSVLTETQLATVTAPEIEGKVFVGWTTGGKLYTNEEVLTQVIIKAATTFTATYVDEMVVTFQDADGVEIATRKTPVNGTIVTPDDPVKDGYSFLGWTTDDGATLVSKADIDQLIITESITYKAVFVPLSITVIFKDGDTVLSEEEVDWGTTLTPPALETPAGMVFVGWLADNDSITYTAADFEGDDAYVATSSVTFTAVWGEVTTVTFIDEHYTSDAGDHVWATETIGRGGKATVPATPANYAGMTFVGWFDGTNTYSEAELAVLVINQDTTFTAIYTDVTYTVTFKNNDGSVFDTATVGDGACAIAPDETPVKVMPASIPSDCFTFAGWTYNGEAWNFDTPVTGNMELVASYSFIENNTAGVIGISTLDELKSIEAGKVYVLTKDITVDTTWGNALPSNNVIVDGDGHTITFTKQMGAPMFAETTAGNDFAIHNLTIKGAISKSSQVILIANFKGNKMTVTNCHILDCTVTNQWGGAFACDVGGTVLFENCTVTGTMNQTGKGNMGGFVGSPLAGVKSDITFRNCTSVVTFNITKAVADGVGGIIGTANKKNADATITFDNCVSECTIVDSLNTDTNKIGGFIGKIYNGSYTTTVIINGGQSNCKMGDKTYAVYGSLGTNSTVTITNLDQNGEVINPKTEE